jgi:hypothetical protein
MSTPKAVYLFGRHFSISVTPPRAPLMPTADQKSPLLKIPAPAEIHRRLVEITREERNLRALLKLALRVRDQQSQREGEPCRA